MTTTHPGATVADNIARHLDRLGWDYDDLASASGLEWGVVVGYRADAHSMMIFELSAIANALGVRLGDLVE